MVEAQEGEQVHVEVALADVVLDLQLLVQLPDRFRPLTLRNLRRLVHLPLDRPHWLRDFSYRICRRISTVLMPIAAFVVNLFETRTECQCCLLEGVDR